MGGSEFNGREGCAVPQLLNMTSKIWLIDNELNPLQVPAAGEVDLFWVDGSLTADEEKLLFSRLGPEQQQAAQRFKVDSARQRYIISRVVLSRILARYLGCSAEEVKYKIGKYGKPCLAQGLDSGPGEGAKPPLVFNMSHSGEAVVCAVAASGWLGIDVECEGRKLGFSDLAERFFAAEEVRQLRRLNQSPEDQRQLFFRIWTLKEAFIKAIGLGLSYPLQDFALKLDSSEISSSSMAQLIRIDDSAWRCEDWSLFSLLGPDLGAEKNKTNSYMSALAYAGVIKKISGRYLPLASFV